MSTPDFLNSEEQGVDLRTTPGAGRGRFLFAPLCSTWRSEPAWRGPMRDSAEVSIDKPLRDLWPPYRAREALRGEALKEATCGVGQVAG